MRVKLAKYVKRPQQRKAMHLASNANCHPLAISPRQVVSDHNGPEEILYAHNARSTDEKADIGQDTPPQRRRGPRGSVYLSDISPAEPTSLPTSQHPLGNRPNTDVKDMMRSQYGFNRKGRAAKNEWNRRRRARTGIDERYIAAARIRRIDRTSARLPRHRRPPYHHALTPEPWATHMRPMKSDFLRNMEDLHKGVRLWHTSEEDTGPGVKMLLEAFWEHCRQTQHQTYITSCIEARALLEEIVRCLFRCRSRCYDSV